MNDAHAPGADAVMDAPLATGHEPAPAAGSEVSGPLTGLWSLAAPASAVKPGRMVGRTLHNAPVLLGRDAEGEVFALRDLCPHRGVRLSGGWFDGREVRCPFHGWRFGVDGTCRSIPSLVADQRVDLSKIGVRAFPCVESQGLVWVRLDDAAAPAGVDVTRPPAIPELGEARPKVVTELIFETDLDNAVYGLLDPAHTPYVHKSRLWRDPDTLQDKAKAYVPRGLGFAMSRHAPPANTTIYKLLGGTPSTEITFELPGVRLEHIRIGRHHICNLTVMTPAEPGRTQAINCLYWTNPIMDAFQPVLRVLARRFLGQDQAIIGEQNAAARFDPPMMLVNDADVPQRWYLRLKREWRRAQASGDGFVNPVKPATLRWRS